MLRGDASQPNRLILYPRPFDSKVEISSLTDALRAESFIGEAFQTDRYLIGSDFLSAIGFLGCAPDIQMEPLEDPQDMRFCHWHFPSASDSPVLIASRTIKPPICPHCRHPHEKWRSNFAEGLELGCPNCNQESPIQDWVWRRKAMCFSRTHIAICNIFEGEAVPDPRLRSLLEEVSGCSWEYCYITP